MQYGLPEKHGLYDPANEKDACGVGFVAQIKGVASHQIVKDANRILCNMDHRGARGSETNTGDGAGMLTAVPDKLLRRAAKEELGIDLPEPGRYGVGNIFMPTDDKERAYCKAAFLKSIEKQGQRFLGWRVVPTDPDGANLGPTAVESMPRIEQLFIGAADGLDQDAFERQLYVIRKSSASPLRVDESLEQRSMLYACSLSSRTIIYKGMLACEQVLPFYGGSARSRFAASATMARLIPFAATRTRCIRDRASSRASSSAMICASFFPSRSPGSRIRARSITSSSFCT